jgi:glutamine cyclotransferase
LARFTPVHMLQSLKYLAGLSALIALSSTLLMTGCSTEDPIIPDDKDSLAPPPTPMITCVITEPINRSSITIGDTINFSVISSYPERTITGVNYFVDSDTLGTSVPDSANANSIVWPTEGVPGGDHVLRAVSTYDDGTEGTQRLMVTIVSDLAPQQQQYRVIQAYPHDPTSYTQGLVFEDGVLYEGTGQKGQSKLRKIQLETGQPIQDIALEQQYFGEGVTILKDRIYQLTWVLQTCFVYDKGNFGLLRSFQYASEGWGLTNNGEHLIMSDGSSTIKFLEPETFKEVRRIEVYSDAGAVPQLNELEYINGEIYANVYRTDAIVRIDPENGKVLGVINLRGLLSPQIAGNAEVLNGIAWDEQGKRLFVTGKYWPQLYHIELTGF